MIINLWSTPRTGSVWYSIFLKSKYQGSILLTEMFNRKHMNMYYFKEQDGRIKNVSDYFDGCFYKDYFLADGKIFTRYIAGQRTRSIDEEENYLISLLMNRDVKQCIIMHNHVDPINKDVRKYLTETATRNIYTYRKDKRSQLYSFAIAKSTKQFAAFKKEHVTTEIVQDIDSFELIDLINRIKVWDSLEKKEIVAYEDIDFFELPGYPYKQNNDHKKRLSENMISLIDQLVIEYENSKS